MKVLTSFLLAHLSFISCGGGYAPVRRNLDNKKPSETSRLSSVLDERCSSQLGQPIYQSTVASVRVTWATSDLRLDSNDGTELSFCELSKREISSAQGFENMSMIFYRREIRIVSLIGSLLSVRDDIRYGNRDESNQPGAPTATSDLYTIDLSRPYTGTENEDKPIKTPLTNFFDAQSIYIQLIKDKDIRQAIKEQNDGRVPERFGDFQKLLAEKGGIDFENYRYTIYEDFLEHFSLDSVDGSNIKVRITFPSRQNRVLDSSDKLIVLPIPETLRSALQKAKAQESGFLSSDGPSLFRDAATLIDLTVEDDRKS